MTHTKALARTHQLIDISNHELHELNQRLQGRFIPPSDADYDAARALWNSMIDRRPAFIVQCQTTQDVIEAVNFANARELIMTVRGAGHNIAGKSMENQAMLIDLSQQRSVEFDPDTAHVSIAPGATLGDLDAATQAHGHVVPVGINSTTGVAGLTLGGGFGWTSRQFGLTIDNLVCAEVVTVDGELRHCDATEHPDLFWGIRGGGGNFGIVTRFTFQAHPTGPDIFCGPAVYALEEDEQLLKRYREFCAQAPDNVSVWAVIRSAPPFPFLPETHHGKPVVVFVGFYNGDMEEGKKALEGIEQFGHLLGSGLAPHRFAEFQQAFDPMLTLGARNYWKSHNFKTISDELIDTLLQYAKQLPSFDSEIFLGQLGGAINRVAPDATAYPHRDIQFVLNLHARWQAPDQDAYCIEWSRDFYHATEPFATGGIYVNFISEGDDLVSSAYSSNYEKLAQIKSKYDPDNRLRTNQNIVPKR